MKETFKHIRFRPETLALIAQCNEIVTDYQAQDLKLTLRQLYYQLVAANQIPNHDRAYKNLSRRLTDARMAGLVDWQAIEDRNRVPSIPQTWGSLLHGIGVYADVLQLDHRADQPNYFEVWVEKAALAGVLEPLTEQHQVPLVVQKGYGSTTALKNAADRFKKHSSQEGHVLYLGDHDPSGEDMVRDVRERLAEMGAQVEVCKLALTRVQVDRYQLPPNPTKTTDSRAEKYSAKHGAGSWELDALPPAVLRELVEAEVDSLTDQGRRDEVRAREGEERERLRTALEAVAP